MSITDQPVAQKVEAFHEELATKAPEEILFLEEMPVNPTGKIDRAGLKRMAEDHLHPHGLEDAAAAG